MTFMYQHHERFYLQILPGTHMAQLCLQYFDMSMCLDKQSPSDALALHSSGFLSSQKKSTDDKKKCMALNRGEISRRAKSHMHSEG